MCKQVSTAEREPVPSEHFTWLVTLQRLVIRIVGMGEHPDGIALGKGARAKHGRDCLA
jgi:hypothetical protein